MQVSLKYDKNNGHFHEDYLAEFFLEWDMFQTKVAEKMKHCMFNNLRTNPPPPPPKNRVV